MPSRPPAGRFYKLRSSDTKRLDDSSEEESHSESSTDGSDYDDHDDMIKNICDVVEDEVDSGKTKQKSTEKQKQKKELNQKKGLETDTKRRQQLPKTEATEKSPSSQNEILSHVKCITCIIAAVLSFVLYCAVGTYSNPAAPSTREEAFLTKLAELKGAFPSQSERFWNVIGAAPMSHLKSLSAPERPVVIMLIGQPGTGPTTACIAKQLGKLYTKALGGPEHSVEPVPVNGSDFAGRDADETKTKLDSRLASGFGSSSKVAIVHSFDRLPACSILLFHSYCENDNAQYKDVAIVLTVELDKSLDVQTAASFKDIDIHVDRHLTRYWSVCPDLQRDKKDAMLSRVANNVALVTEEQNLAICPT